MVMQEKGITQRELAEKMIEQGAKIDLPRINNAVSNWRKWKWSSFL
jgi:hypothetical protein